MSCWVVPTVAAEYWGVTLDVVWRRIYEGLVPHTNDRGFVFVDVDPWTPDADGALLHDPPATFVASDTIMERAGLDSTCPPADLFDPLEYELLIGDGADDLVEERAPEPPPEDAEPATASLEDELEDTDEDEEESDEDELPELDDDETATFGRLSWHEVRRQVSRTRVPPRRA